jgi:hypothetical protein
MTNSISTIARDVAGYAQDAAQLAAERTQELAQHAAAAGRHGLEQIGVVSPRAHRSRWWIPTLLAAVVLGAVAVVIGRSRRPEPDVRSVEIGGVTPERPLSAVG